MDLFETEWDIAFRTGQETQLERITNLLESERRKCEQAGLFANDPNLRSDLQTMFVGLSMALDLIKGEQK
jgi:hypothetical protein